MMITSLSIGEILLTVLIVILIIYIVGRVFAKGILHEADNYINRKFLNLTTKKQKNGTEEKK